MASTSKPLVNRKFENVQKKYKFDNDPTKSTFGRGSFGVVRKCYHWRPPKRVYACKTIPKSSTPSNLLVREVTNLQKINTHKYIISLIDVYEDSKFIHLICEPCFGGELYDRVLSNSKEVKLKFTDEDCAYLIRNILLAIAYMHTVPHIVHRDLKASNFLFLTQDNNQDIKIIDFGLSKYVPTKSRCEKCRTFSSTNTTCGGRGGHTSGNTTTTAAGDNNNHIIIKKTTTFDSILEEDDDDEVVVDTDSSRHNNNNNSGISGKANQDNNNNDEEDDDDAKEEQDNNNNNNNETISTETQLLLDQIHTNYDCDCNLGRLKSKVGTPYYVAPEIMKQESYTQKCDVWSIGCIAYFIFCGELPFQGQSEKQTLDIITQYYDDYNIIIDEKKEKETTTEENIDGDNKNEEGEDMKNKNENENNKNNNITKEGLYDSNKHEIWSRIPLAKDFIECLLEPNPHKRLSAVKALEHPYLLRYCGEPPSDLRGIDDDSDDDFTSNNKPRWGAISRFGARITTDDDLEDDDDDLDDSERNIHVSTSTNRSVPFFGKLFRKTRSSFQ